MFEMFKGMGQLAGLMRNLPKLREEMEKLQQRLGQLTAEGDAGAGMVKVKVNGRLEVQSCQLSDEAVKGGDRELLEDLITAATNQALDKARQLVSEETSKAAGGMGLPAGMSLPGMG
jgi:DNA-binding YbaB/EbfC family protein